MGTKNNPGSFDCYHAAGDDEPMFILLARDPLAPTLVRAWAGIRERLKIGNPEKVFEALQCAEDMEHWAADHPERGPVDRKAKALKEAHAILSDFNMLEPGHEDIEAWLSALSEKNAGQCDRIGGCLLDVGMDYCKCRPLGKDGPLSRSVRKVISRGSKKEHMQAGRSMTQQLPPDDPRGICPYYSEPCICESEHRDKQCKRIANGQLPEKDAEPCLGCGAVGTHTGDCDI